MSVLGRLAPYHPVLALCVAAASSVGCTQTGDVCYAGEELCEPDDDPCTIERCIFERPDDMQGTCGHVVNPECVDGGPPIRYDGGPYDAYLDGWELSDVPEPLPDAPEDLDAFVEVADAAPSPDAGPDDSVSCGKSPERKVDPEREPAGTFDPATVACVVPPPSGAGGGGGVGFPTCFLTTSVFAPAPGDPPDPDACPIGMDALSTATDETGRLVARAGGQWRWVASSVPVQAGFSRAILTSGVEATLVLEHQPTDTWVDFVVEATDGFWDYRAIRVHGGPLPHYGAAFPCGAERRTYTAVTVDGAFDAYARICDGETYGVCTVHGPIESTPEDEACTTYAVALGYSAGAPMARGISGLGYYFTATTHGTISGGSGRNVTGVPLDTDVTMTAEGTSTLEIVARWLSTGGVEASVRVVR